MKKLSSGTLAIIVIVLVIVIDQFSKIWVKTHMSLGEMIEITSWFKIYFIENNGMAFGMEVIGKLFLSIFRIIAVGGIAYFLYKLVKENKYPKGFIVCFALIWAGAFGNIIDSVFYGQFFTASYPGTVSAFTTTDGYADWLHGKVVDMLYFPLIEWTWSGEKYVFFSPVFNIADSAITVGIFILLIGYFKSLGKLFEKSPKK